MGTNAGSSMQETVYESARRLLAERDGKESEVTSWLLGSEVARDTGLDKDRVLQTLVELGNDRLRVKMAAGGDEVEVIGVGDSAAGGSLS